MAHSGLIILFLTLHLTTNGHFAYGKGAAGFMCTTTLDCDCNLVCYKRTCTEICSTDICGPNALCKVTNRVPICSCKPGYTFKSTECVKAVEPSSCTYREDCGPNLSCQDLKCVDPCVAACGKNAVCGIRNQTAVCSCAPGYKGDPWTNCTREYKKRNCTKELSVIRTEYTWIGGLLQCKAAKKEYVTIENRCDQNNMEKFLIKEGVDLAWIGLSYEDKKWSWNKTGKESRFTNWKPKEPNHLYRGDIENCVEVNARERSWDKLKGNEKYQWNDIACLPYTHHKIGRENSEYYRLPICEKTVCKEL